MTKHPCNKCWSVPYLYDTNKDRYRCIICKKDKQTQEEWEKDNPLTTKQEQPKKAGPDATTIAPIADPVGYVPPVATLPELEPTRDFGRTMESNEYGKWMIELHSLNGLMLTVRHVDRATARRAFNAAFKAMRGDG